MPIAISIEYGKGKGADLLFSFSPLALRLFRSHQLG
jgi:hypothetical protein